MAAGVPDVISAFFIVLRNDIIVHKKSKRELNQFEVSDKQACRRKSRYWISIYVHAEKVFFYHTKVAIYQTVYGNGALLL